MSITDVQLRKNEVKQITSKTVTLLLDLSETKFWLGGRGKVSLLLDPCLTSLKFRASAEDPAMFQPLSWEPMQKTEKQQYKDQRVRVVTAIPEREGICWWCCLSVTASAGKGVCTLQL